MRTDTKEGGAFSRAGAVSKASGSRSSDSAVRWHAGSLNNGLIFGLTYHLVTRLPRAGSYAIGHAGTWLAYHLMREGTRAVVGNLRVVRPDATERELKRLALLTYRSYGRDTIDFIRSLGMSRPEFEPMMAGLDSGALADLLAQRRGVVIVGGHFGNWELAGVALRLMHGYPLTVIGKSEASPAVGAIRRRMRESLGIETIEIGRMLETALRIRSLLAANGIVAMLLDRHLGRDRIDVTFFGRPAGFLRTPAMIGYLSGAPLLPAFMIRQADNRFVAALGDPILVDSTKPTEDAVRAATQAFAAQLEDRIRANPQLWYQFYPYWRTAGATQDT
jgi:phosphatidylinositol dimannoside acyltransferase